MEAVLNDFKRALEAGDGYGVAASISPIPPPSDPGRLGVEAGPRELAHRDPDDALARASARVKDWESGTRIAPALREFNRLWSRRVLGQNAVVMLFTAVRPDANPSTRDL